MTMTFSPGLRAAAGDRSSAMRPLRNPSRWMGFDFAAVDLHLPALAREDRGVGLGRRSGERERFAEDDLVPVALRQDRPGRRAGRALRGVVEIPSAPCSPPSRCACSTSLRASLQRRGRLSRPLRPPSSARRSDSSAPSASGGSRPRATPRAAARARTGSPVQIHCGIFNPPDETARAEIEFQRGRQPVPVAAQRAERVAELLRRQPARERPAENELLLLPRRLDGRAADTRATCR